MAHRNRFLNPVGWLCCLVLAAGCGEGEETSEPPHLLQGQPVAYPIELWDEGLEGEAVVMVHVSPAGVVDSAFVTTTSGHAAFDSAAIRGAFGMRFAPALSRGRRVGAWVRLPVRFARDTLSTDAAVRDTLGEAR